TREIAAYGGLVNNMPLYAFTFMVFTMANVGLPGTSGFVGEFLSLMGAFKSNTWVAFVATSGVILSAGYALWLYRRVVFGKLEKSALKHLPDMTPRELATLGPLIVLTVFFGAYPAPILDIFGTSVENLIKPLQQAAEAARLLSTAALQ
ncbi:MAG: NADH-quinone oxidoreductase subunit M, partial [Alphaproteobacteria bacterium]|nr:NADH-quinone oxidoreductase subunit M [Alphaproteobacteria bacterium]